MVRPCQLDRWRSARPRQRCQRHPAGGHHCRVRHRWCARQRRPQFAGTNRQPGRCGVTLASERHTAGGYRRHHARYADTNRRHAEQCRPHPARHPDAVRRFAPDQRPPQHSAVQPKWWHDHRAGSPDGDAGLQPDQRRCCGGGRQHPYHAGQRPAGAGQSRYPWQHHHQQPGRSHLAGNRHRDDFQRQHERDRERWRHATHALRRHLG